MQYIPIGNPIWSCQLQLLRGLRGMFSTAIIYASIAYGAFLLYRRADISIPLAAASANAMRVGVFIQLGLMTVAGSGAIHKALMRDHTTRMIDTLRISPMSAWQVAIGCIFGPALQMIGLWGVGVLLGLVFATLGQAGAAADWLLGNLYLLPIAASLWGMQVLFCVGHTRPFNLIALIAILAMVLAVSRTHIYAIGPFFLVGGYTSMAACSRMLGRELPFEGVSLAVSAAMTFFWIAAAASRFRQPHRPLLQPLAAVLFVAIWCTAGVLGIAYRNHSPVTGGMPPLMPAAPIVFLILTLIVAQIPAVMAMQQRRRNIDGATIYRRRDAWPPFVTVMLTMIIVTASAIWLVRVCGAAADHINPSAGAYCAVALALAMLTAFGVVKAMYCVFNKLIFASFLAVILWAFPPIVDLLIRKATVNEYAAFQEGYSILFAISPVGTFLASWTGIQPPIAAGLVVQGVIAVVALVIARGVEHRLIAARIRLKCKEADEDAARQTPSPAPASPH